MILLFVMILEEKFNEEDIFCTFTCMHSCSNCIFQCQISEKNLL